MVAMRGLELAASGSDAGWAHHLKRWYSGAWGTQIRKELSEKAGASDRDTEVRG